ncbi:MAG: PorV/PorQ family protein [Chitinophagales bacterium]|nr:PorV/PorQ family protein [Chitinophagales bacterium]MDW8394480.1 PorV/PorQ family protein [Chitinophagales bacterium]
MNKLFLATLLLLAGFGAHAGNRDRQGEAGASELLINPWASSSGWDGINTSCVTGVEALNLNVAGLAFVRKTELVFSHTEWLSGTGIRINTFGFGQSLGARGGVIGASVMSVDFGEIPITTTSLPEGGLGTYSPQFINLAVAYSKEFSNSIYGGVVFRGISEAISDVTAFGAAVDAGIQYVTGPRQDPDRVKFGIAIRNIGTRMTFGGDGLSFRGFPPESQDYTMTLEQRSQGYELPSLLNIGISYALPLNKENLDLHVLTLAGNFTSNSFSQDQVGAGVEYAFRQLVMLRAGYNYQNNLTDPARRPTALTGFSAGLSFLVPLKKGGPRLGMDYSYRTSDPFNGTHSAGLRIVL